MVSDVNVVKICREICTVEKSAYICTRQKKKCLGMALQGGFGKGLSKNIWKLQKFTLPLYSFRLGFSGEVFLTGNRVL